MTKQKKRKAKEACAMIKGGCECESVNGRCTDVVKFSVLHPHPPSRLPVHIVINVNVYCRVCQNTTVLRFRFPHQQYWYFAVYDTVLYVVDSNP